MAMFNLGKFLEEFQDLAIALVVVGIVIAFGASFLGDQKSDIEADEGTNSTAYTAVSSAEDGILDLAQGITDVTGIAVIVVVLAMLFILSRMNN
jgi:hypothetical protein